MKMTRKQALCAVGALVAGFAGKRVVANVPTSILVMESNVLYTSQLTMTLGQYKKIIFECEGEKIEISGKELFEAIKTEGKSR